MERTCPLVDCDRPSRGGPGSLCPMHYHRQYRHGGVERTAAQLRTYERRYRSLHRPAHPLAGPSGRVYEHRLVAFARYGATDLACHWCGCRLAWSPSTDEALPAEVDHLDADGANNDGGNLVLACRRCNTARAAQRRHDALVARGFWSARDTVAATTAGRRALVGA